MGWKTNSIQRKVLSFIVVFSLTLNISASVDESIQKHKKHFSNIAMQIWSNAEPVSYTHLTLPTTPYV